MKISRPYAIGSALPPTQREGISLLAAVMLVTTISALSVSALMMSNAAVKRQVADRQQLSARYAADAGLAEAVSLLRGGKSVELAALADRTEFGGAGYWVESLTDGNGVTSFVANGEMGNANYRQQLVVRMAPRSIYSYGAFGDEHLELASNAQVDSYDSDLGLYEDLEIYGSGQSAWANDQGNIGSNDDIVLRQNARTYGDALPGPGDTVKVVGNAYVTGSTNSAPDVQVLEPVVIPEGPSSGALAVANSDTVQLGPGTHIFGAGSVGVKGLLEIKGPAQVVFDSLTVNKNSSVRVDASAGLVEIFVRHDFILSSNTLMASLDFDADGLAIYLESDNIIDPGEEIDLDEIDFESNSKLYGTIYAPNAKVVINSNFELYGAVASRRLRLDSNSQVHYDERLVEDRDDSVITLDVIGWRVLPRRATEPYSSQGSETELPTIPEGPIEL